MVGPALAPAIDGAVTMWSLSTLRSARLAYLLVCFFEELAATFTHLLAKYEKPEKIYPRDTDDWTM